MAYMDRERKKKPGWKNEPGIVQIRESDSVKPRSKRTLFTVPAWYWDNPEPVEVWR